LINPKYKLKTFANQKVFFFMGKVLTWETRQCQNNFCTGKQKFLFAKIQTLCSRKIATSSFNRKDQRHKDKTDN
jgi:hypothetical protein